MTVDEIMVNDYINVLIEKYDLKKYKYIDNVISFSLLPLRGSMRYINRYTHELKIGGLLVKIYKKDNNWYGVIKKGNEKRYHVSFKSNYIFYLEYKSKNDKLKQTLELFMSDVNSGKYNIIN